MVRHDSHANETHWINHFPCVNYNSILSSLFVYLMPVLTLTIVNATDLRETEFFGSKQDPYVIVQTDCDTRKTNTHMDGGRNPGML